MLLVLAASGAVFGLAAAASTGNELSASLRLEELPTGIPMSVFETIPVHIEDELNLTAIAGSNETVSLRLEVLPTGMPMSVLETIPVHIEDELNLTAIAESNETASLKPRSNVPAAPYAVAGALVAPWHGVNDSALVSPVAVAVLGPDVYIAESTADRVTKWPLADDGVLVGGLAAGYNNTGGAKTAPAAVAVESVGDDTAVYIADGNRVTKWLPGAEGVSVAGSGGNSAALSDVGAPSGLAVVGGIVYVSERLNNRVTKWVPGAAEGVVVAGGHGAGAGLDQLNEPRGVAVGEDGAVYVADALNHRVVRWNVSATAGTVVAGNGTAGSDLLELNTPWGVAVREQDVYVADSKNNRVVVWSQDAVGRGYSREGAVVAEGTDGTETHGVALAPASLVATDADGVARVWSLPCKAPVVEHALAPSCTMAGGELHEYIPVGDMCTPQCKPDFEPQMDAEPNPILECAGELLSFTCGLKQAPSKRVVAVTFSDTNEGIGNIEGSVSWTEPPDTDGIEFYVIYYSPNIGLTDLTLIGEVPVGTTSYSIGGQAGEPVSATSGYILVVAKNAVGESTKRASVPFDENTGGAPDESGSGLPARVGFRALSVSPGACVHADSIPETCWKQNETAKYLFFDRVKAETILGDEVVTGRTYRVLVSRKEMDYWRGSITVYCDDKLLPHNYETDQPEISGDCRAVRTDDPKENDWQLNDVLQPLNFRVLSVNDPGVSGCYNPNSACCSGSQKCWPTPANWFFFSSTAAETVLGYPISNNTIVDVRHLRAGDEVWRGNVIFQCGRPEDDSPALVGDCRGRQDPTDVGEGRKWEPDDTLEPLSIALLPDI